MGHLNDPVRIEEDSCQRTVTFMGAARFSIDKELGLVRVSQLAESDGEVTFVRDHNATVINLPVRLNGFWLDPFLPPWRKPIADCLIDHHATGSAVDWYAAIKLELQRALGRSTHWYRLRCHLRDALKLDPQAVLWCRKGRQMHKDYVTQVQYNDVIADRATYQRIEDDSPNLVWLCNFLRAEEYYFEGDQPVADMKAWLRNVGGVTDAGWRLIANGKEQDFRHIIDFVDENGRVSGRHEYLPKWLRMLGKLRRSRAVPRPLAGLFSHDTYDGFSTEEGDRVRFRNVDLQPGVLCAILEEGERRLARGSHQRFVEEDIIEVLVWLQAEGPVLDKNQLRQGWKYLASRAVAWRVEREACDTLKNLAWESLLPETQIGQWRIVPLTDAWQLRREALTRRHCCDQYVDECMSGDYRLFSVRSNRGKSVATIGIERKDMNWSVFGFRGFANRPVPEALYGLEREVLQRYSDLWQLAVPAAKPLPPALERKVELVSESRCPYCGETEVECEHVVAARDTCSGELLGGALYPVYEELANNILEEIRHAGRHGEFRFAVSDDVRLLAYYYARLIGSLSLDALLTSDHTDIAESIFDRLERCRNVKITAWEFLDGAPGTATTFRCYWAREPALVVEWLRAQFQPALTEAEIDARKIKLLQGA